MMMCGWCVRDIGSDASSPPPPPPPARGPPPGRPRRRAPSSPSGSSGTGTGGSESPPWSEHGNSAGLPLWQAGAGSSDERLRYKHADDEEEEDPTTGAAMLLLPSEPASLDDKPALSVRALYVCALHLCVCVSLCVCAALVCVSLCVCALRLARLPRC
jgi:hypothetical protein